MAVFYDDDDRAVFDLYPGKTKEELIPIIEDSITYGDDLTQHFLKRFLEKIKLDLAQQQG